MGDLKKKKKKKKKWFCLFFPVTGVYVSDFYSVDGVFVGDFFLFLPRSVAFSRASFAVAFSWASSDVQFL